ncbi:MAG: LLM class flavin-dependent oxidoreductase [Halioglobus sp.]|nr:LLM class flavin-dependent oxidoreductase [Halioglobus sp.]|tara:strand:+ start:3458 stop:4468 length:1011 start_codon:yes stop_codon:yes gene_type:complete
MPADAPPARPPQRNIVLRFDMRRSPACPDAEGERYRAALDMAAWADDCGVDVIGLSEHHVTADGFLSAPLTLAAMMAARTRRVRISVSALLVPLHDPLRLAEDIAALDLASSGRFTATAGLGYRQEEYARFDVDWSRRGAIFDARLSQLVAALKGESFSRHGAQMRLNPTPASPVQALLTIGGNSAAAARRAARFGLIFCPAIDDPALDEIYRQACAEHGVGFGMTIFPREPSTTFISEDPARTWRDIGDYLLYDATAYGAWRHPNRRAYAESFATDLDGLIAEGKYRILTPQQAVEVVQQTGSLHLAPLCGGVPLDAGWRSLRLFQDQVLPHLAT